MKIFKRYYIFLIAAMVIMITACHHAPRHHDIIFDIHKLDKSVQQDIEEVVNYMMEHNGSFGDSVNAFHPHAIFNFYKQNNFSSQWCRTGAINPSGNFLIQSILHADNNGLKSSWYEAKKIDSLTTQLTTDTLAQHDAAKWAYLDVLLTNAFTKMATDLHFGVLPQDSVSLRKDSAYSDSILINLTSIAAKNNNAKAVIDSLQPQFSQYDLLKKALQQFKKKYAYHHWDALPLNYNDTAAFKQAVVNRLLQSGDLDSSEMNDEKKIKSVIKNFQLRHHLYPDGVVGKKTIQELNLSKDYRLQQIGLNMERWRHFSDTMPSEYLLVNLPAFELQLWDNDTLRIESRIVVGAPDTRTPELNSSITNFIMYPYWRVPMSIVAKEILPAIKRDTGYLRKKKFEVIDRHNNAVDPTTINWKKYNKNYFPFVLQQSEGLDNALGILKFNFANKYSVYLHDTNARYLFSNSFRALSHGCVRVQQWQKLMYYLVKNDTARNPADSLQAWMSRKQKKRVNLSHRLPIYIRYFTCYVKNGELNFYEDIYGEDKKMMQQMYGKAE